MYMPINLVLFSPYALPIWLSGTPFIDRLSPVISFLSYGSLITIFFFSQHLEINCWHRTNCIAYINFEVCIMV